MITHRIPSYLNAAWANQWSAGTYSNSTTFTISGNVTSAYVADNAIRILNGSNLYYSYIVSATFSTNTTVVIADAVLVSGNISSDYSILPNNNAVGRGFQEIKVVGTRGFSVWNGASQNVSISQSGVVTAVSFAGNGASLTNLTWGNISGVPTLVNSFNGRTGAVNPAANDYALAALATVTISSPSANQVLTYNGSAWINAALPAPPAVPVTSVFGRTGAIAAVVGDYSSFYGQLAAANTWIGTQTINNTVIINSTLTVKNGTSEADIYFGPNDTYLYSTSSVALGLYSTSQSGIFSIAYPSKAATFAGTVVAPLFSGSGASLTNLPWSSLTGVPSLVNSFNGRTGAVVPAVNDYNLTQLAGVSISSPSTNQVLTYNGTNWVNLAVPAAPVSSVFGRTGAVGAQVGDYSAWYAQFAASNTFSGSLNIFNNQIRISTGSCGNYSTVATVTWGGPIWGMDTSYTGGIGAANWSPSGVYGIAWQRASSSNANANIGEGLYVYVNGVLEGGIGTVGIYTPGALVAATGNFTSSSIRYKENVHDLVYNGDILARLIPKEFTLKSNGRRSIGLIAEEIADFLPEVVNFVDEKPDSIDYSKLSMYLIQEINHLKSRINA